MVYFLPKMQWKVTQETVKIPENGVMANGFPQLKASPQEYDNWKMLEYSTEQNDIVGLDFENVSGCAIHPKVQGKATVVAQDKFNDENRISTEVTVKGFYITDPQGTVNESIVEQGKTLQLTGKGVNADEITWKTDDTEVAKVGEKTGLVEGLKTGKAVIKAYSDRKSVV